MNAPREGTHSKAQYLLELKLVHKKSTAIDDYKWFQEKFQSFKKERVIADYKSNILTVDKGYDAIKTAQSIITVLKKHF